MSREKILIVALMILSLNISSVAQSLNFDVQHKISSSDDETLKLSGVYGKTIGKTEKGIYVLSKKRKAVILKQIEHIPSITLINAENLQILKSQEIQYSEDDEFSFENIIQTKDGSIYAFTSIEKSEAIIYNRWKFNEDSFLFEDKQDLGSSKKMSNTGWRPRSKLFISYSPDDSKILLYDRQMIKTGGINYFICVLNKDLKHLWSKGNFTKKAPSKGLFIEVPWMLASVSNEGKVAIMSKTKAGKKNNFNLQVLNSEEKPNRRATRLLLPELSRAENVIHLKFGDDENIQLHGAYGFPKGKGGIQGVFRVDINPKTKKIISKKIHEFSSTEINSLCLSDDTKNLHDDNKANKKIIKSEKKLVKSLEKNGLADLEHKYSTLGVFTHLDGSFSLVIQRVSENPVKMNTPTSPGASLTVKVTLQNLTENLWRKPLPNPTTVHVSRRIGSMSYRNQALLYEDLIFINLSPEGELNWIKNLDGRGTSTMPTSVFKINDKIIALYPYGENALKVSAINSNGSYGQKIVWNENFEDESDFYTYSSDIDGLISKNQYIGFLVDPGIKFKAIPFQLKFR